MAHININSDSVANMCDEKIFKIEKVRRRFLENQINELMEEKTGLFPRKACKTRDEALGTLKKNDGDWSRYDFIMNSLHSDEYERALSIKNLAVFSKSNGDGQVQLSDSDYKFLTSSHV